DAEGVPRGRGVSGAVPDHRLQPLHRAWIRPPAWHGPAEGRRAVRPLAAVPVQPHAPRRGEEPHAARLEGAEPPAPAVRVQRDPLHDAGPQRSAGRASAPRSGAGRRARPLADVRAPGRDACQRHRPRRRVMTDLSTTYLGLALRNPLVASAGPLCESVDNIRRMEDAGAAAVVLPSLFEEQITVESHELDRYLSDGTESFAESLTYFPDLGRYNIGPDAYLEHVRRAKATVDIPII